eukprot:TRINITY_DN91416_c0_g1_i1.p1 TRINITY_DN91416_c0_g1~~TRINITY_DN91416_c0_g1_i1.p1  ORF type:complete len:594 (-),score=92.51 TRINITY_DN91416_c0_g1_i1:139-1920(-)
MYQSSAWRSEWFRKSCLGCRVQDHCTRRDSHVETNAAGKSLCKGGKNASHGNASCRQMHWKITAIMIGKSCYTFLRHRSRQTGCQHRTRMRALPGEQGSGDRRAEACCSAWGCSCTKLQGHPGNYNFQSSSDYHRGHPGVKGLSEWCRLRGHRLPHVYRTQQVGGYRTRGTYFVGSEAGGGATVVGLCKERSWKVLPALGCATSHPALEEAVRQLQEVLNEMRDEIPLFPHGSKEPWKCTDDALRHAEFTVERRSSLVQLVLIWNGQRGSPAPSLHRLVERLWDSGGAVQRLWHSIFVHWREPNAKLKRAVHSRLPDAWQQLRPVVQPGIEVLSGETLEVLDGLPFHFGPSSFQQANLSVYDRMLRDMKSALSSVSKSIRVKADRPLRLLELCGGVGVIGLSLAHAATSWADAPLVELLTTDVNGSSGKSFYASARRLFPDAEELAAGALESGTAGVRMRFEELSAEDAIRRLLQAHWHGADSGSWLLDGHGYPDVLILDPPRRGLARDRRNLTGHGSGEKEVQTMRRCKNLEAIIYMSCGHESFAHDADLLTRGATRARGNAWGAPFRLAALACYDMFPYTSQIETLGIFVR